MSAVGSSSSSWSRPTRIFFSLLRIGARLGRRHRGAERLSQLHQLGNVDPLVDDDALDAGLPELADQLLHVFGGPGDGRVLHNQVFADDADGDRRRRAVHDVQHFGERIDAALDQRVSWRVQRHRAKRRRQAPDHLVDESDSLGGAHARSCCLRGGAIGASRAALRTPRLPFFFASSSTWRASGEPMRPSARAAARRRVAVRVGAHHSPR